MPDVSSVQRHKLNRDPISDAHLVLLEFQEDGSPFIHRAVANNEDYFWRNENYVQCSIGVEFPGSGDQGARARLVASNIDRILGRAIDAAERRINVRLILVDVSAPDRPLIDTKNLLVISNASGMVELNVDLGPRASLQEPVPPVPTTQAGFPGVFFA